MFTIFFNETFDFGRQNPIIDSWNVNDTDSAIDDTEIVLERRILPRGDFVLLILNILINCHLSV